MKNLKDTINDSLITEAWCKWDPSKAEIEKMELEKQEFEKNNPGVIKEYEKLKKEEKKLEDELEKISEKIRNFKIKNNCNWKTGWNEEWFWEKGHLYDC